MTAQYLNADIFVGRTQQRALGYLQECLDSKKGISFFAGPQDVGKSTLCRLFISKQPLDITVIYIDSTNEPELNISESIYKSLKIRFRENLSSKSIIFRIYLKLLNAKSKGQRYLLILDHADDISYLNFNTVTTLSKLKVKKESLLPVIVCGRNIFDLVFALSQRVRAPAKYHLFPMAKGETEQYISKKLATFNSPVQFSYPAVKLLYKHTKGIPGKIDDLVKRASVEVKRAGRKDINHRALNAVILGNPIINLNLLPQIVTAAVLIFIIGISTNFLTNITTPEVEFIPISQEADEPKMEVKEAQSSEPIKHEVQASIYTASSILESDLISPVTSVAGIIPLVLRPKFVLDIPEFQIYATSTDNLNEIRVSTSPPKPGVSTEKFSMDKAYRIVIPEIDSIQ